MEIIQKVLIFFDLDRRRRFSRPLTLIIFCFILFIFSIWESWDIFYIHKDNFLIYNILYKALVIFLVLCPIVISLGLFLLKKWAWYIFLVYSVIIIVHNIVVFVFNSKLYNLFTIFEAGIFFGMSVYFLRRDISSPYFDFHPRGFRGEKRTPIQVDIMVNEKRYKTNDISETGFYIEMESPNFELNSEVSVKVEINGSLSNRKAGVVRIEKDGVGFAFRK